MFNQVKCETPDLAKQNLEKLKALFPGVVTEGSDGVAIDVEALKQECSATPIEGNVERYEFTWPGKRAAKAAASTATSKTLRPCRAESVNFDTTENLYIEGDNLEVLKLLQTNYAGKVKMIYIDPPYNTGHDFVYRDRFSLTQKELESDAGAFDDDGNRFEVNDSSEARYHSNWCSMMYPRLKLARQLLTDDGVMILSIDYNECVNLHKLLIEIFGEENIINDISVKMSELSGVKMKHLTKFAKLKETVVIVAKNIHSVIMNIEKKPKDADKLKEYLRYYSKLIVNKDEPDVSKWRIENVDEYTKSLNLSENELNEWKIKNAERMVYRTNSRTVEAYMRKFPDAPSICKFQNEEGVDVIKWDNKEMLFLSKYTEEYLGDIWTDISTINLNKENCEVPFSNGQKPLMLINRILKCVNTNSSVILDFFSGSATTAHAVMQLNLEDGGNRKFIMVQLPESCAEDSEAAKAGYKNICEIGKERIRRAGKKISDELRAKSEELKKKAEKNGPNLFDEQSIEQSNNPNNRTIPDIGFRVLKLDSSSLEEASETASGTQQQMLGLSRIKEDRTSEDLLFQVLLESKLSLSDRIEKKKVEGNEVFFVSDTALVACLDAKAKMTEKFFTALAKFQPALAFFRDDLFESDSARINLAQIFKQFSPNTTITVI